MIGVGTAVRGLERGVDQRRQVAVNGDRLDQFRQDVAAKKARSEAQVWLSA